MKIVTYANSHFISLHSQRTFDKEISFQFLNQIFKKVNLVPGIYDLIKEQAML